MTSLPVWSNQDLLLFHGTTIHAARNIVAEGVDVAIGKPDRDFGRGFYCTSSEVQAREWADIKAARSSEAAAVVRFEMPRQVLGELRALVFIRATANAADFWSFVQFCRSGGVAHGKVSGSPYDVVYGPVALNWFTSAFKIKQDSDQISFHTTAAQRALNLNAGRSILEP